LGFDPFSSGFWGISADIFGMILTILSEFRPAKRGDLRGKRGALLATWA
jgi:hypothetical protein